MTLPPTPDVTIYFPFVQRCEVGEIRWIGIPTDPGDELDEPAPAMFLSGPVAATAAPATTVSPSTTAVDTAAPTTTAEVEPAVPASTEAVDVASSTDVTVAAAPDEVGDPDTGTWFFVASIVAVLVIGVIVYFRARSARAAQDSTSP